MLFTGIVFTLIGILARTYAGISEIHDSTWKAMKASIIRKVAALAGNISLIIGILSSSPQKTSSDIVGRG